MQKKPYKKIKGSDRVKIGHRTCGRRGVEYTVYARPEQLEPYLSPWGEFGFEWFEEHLAFYRETGYGVFIPLDGVRVVKRVKNVAGDKPPKPEMSPEELLAHLKSRYKGHERKKVLGFIAPYKYRQG